MAEVRALVWTGGQRFELARRPLPVLADGELLVRVRTAAICGSDRHTVEGRRSSPCPGVLGHEGVGEVAAIGPTHPAAPRASGVPGATGASGEPGASGAPRGPGAPGATGDPLSRVPRPAALDGSPLQVGDRIVWSVVSACGDCDRCLGGHTAKCRRLRKAGHEPFTGSWPLSGSYASHVVLPRGHDVVRVPEEVADGPASVAACAGATVMAALDAVPPAATAGVPSGALAGARVLVSGVGMLGLLAIAAVREAGAEHVHAIDPSAVRRDLALRAGADEASSPGDDAAGPLAPLDVSFEFSGAPAGVETAIRALDIGGTAVLAGSVFPGPPVALDPEHLVRGRRRVLGVHNYEPRHLAQAVDLLASPRGQGLDWASILSSPIALEDAPAAFATPPTTLRTLLRP